MTGPAPQHYRVPSVRVARRVGPRLPALDSLYVCPVCNEPGFRAVELATTTLLYCSAGCRGRAIASALGLADWPEGRS